MEKTPKETCFSCRRRTEVGSGLLAQRPRADSSRVDYHCDCRHESYYRERPSRRRAPRAAAGRPREVAAKRADIHVENRARDHAGPRREKIIAQSHPRQPVRVVEQVEWKYRRQARQDDNLPSFLADSFVDRLELRVAFESRADPIAREIAPDEKRRGSAERRRN